MNDSTMNYEPLVHNCISKPGNFQSYRVFVVFLIFAFGNLSAQTSYIEIKNHRAQTATYGQIDLSKNRGIKKTPQLTIQVPKIDSVSIQKIRVDLTDCAAPDDTLDILIYIHAMWGGANFFESKILRTFSPEIIAPNGKIDKVLPIIWHAGTDYEKNLPKAYHIGELLGANIGYLLQNVEENADKTVRFHLLCHSMGHQVFRGIYKVNDENENFRFGEIIFAAPDVAYDILGKEWNKLPLKCERLTFFFNKKDRALKISEKKLKIKRLGKEGSTVKIPNNVKEIDVSNIEDTKGLSPKYSGHGYFFASKTVRRIIIRLLNN